MINKKETFFAGMSMLSVVVFVFCLLIMQSFYLAGIAYLFHVLMVLTLAIISPHNWIFIFFLVTWFLAGLIFPAGTPSFVVLFALPLIYLFFAFRKELKTHIKVRFFYIMKPCMSKFVVISLVFASLAIANNFKDDQVRDFVAEKASEQTLTKRFDIDIQKLIEPYLNSSIEAQCQGNQVCEEQMKKKVFAQLNTAGTQGMELELIDAQTLVDTFDNIASAAKVKLSYVVAGLFFLAFFPFSFLISLVLTTLFSFLLGFMRPLRVLRLTHKAVEQEVLV
jgi:hypothetical protein